jgi:RNA polymerase sigma-70 factor (ECF subfamily)
LSVNVARDLLRRRRRREYIGPWLPGPIATRDGERERPRCEPTLDGQRTLEGRYDLMESVSLAFLHAFEPPAARAIGLGRDAPIRAIERLVQGAYAIVY